MTRKGHNDNVRLENIYKGRGRELKIVFFGSSEFAVPSLKALIQEGYKIPCLVTQVDKLSGRGLHLAVTPVKEAAKQFGLNIYQPLNIKDKNVEDYLKKISADLFVVIAYGQILPQKIIDIPKLFSLNLHGSLLPKYRGAAPLNWAIIKGDKITGVTIIKMDSSMDTGPVISRKKVLINEADTALSLGEKLSNIGAQLLIDTVKLIENNKFKLTPQDGSEATLAPKMKKENGLVDWSKGAEEISNLIRGCIAWPGAFTYYKGKLLKIYKAQVEPLSGYPVPGEIINVSKEGVIVATEKGGLIIKELQIEGKRRMFSPEFIAGHKIRVGEALGKNK